MTHVSWSAVIVAATAVSRLSDGYSFGIRTPIRIGNGNSVCSSSTRLEAVAEEPPPADQA